MNFVSYQDLINDVRKWSDHLPDNIIAICGIPRSGLLPATLLSLHRNCHLLTLQEILTRDVSWNRPLRRGNVKAEGERILIVDDSVNHGTTIREMKSKIQQVEFGYTVEFGAVYARPESRQQVDYCCREIQHPRCFEWNVFHSEHMKRSCLDLDGVLCNDADFQEEDSGEGLSHWLNHVTSAKPLYIPSFPVYAIVTSRLEKYREATANWLARHGVQYGKLIMSPHCSATERRQSKDHGKRKADYFKSQRSTRLFIESSESQALEISRLSKKPVLSVETMKLHR